MDRPIDTTSGLTDGQTNLYFNCPLCDPPTDKQTNATPGLEKKNTTEGGSPQHTKLKNQQQQEKIESILFFFTERKQKVAVNFKDI